MMFVVPKRKGNEGACGLLTASPVSLSSAALSPSLWSIVRNVCSCLLRQKLNRCANTPIHFTVCRFLRPLWRAVCLPRTKQVKKTLRPLQWEMMVWPCCLWFVSGFSDLPCSVMHKVEKSLFLLSKYWYIFWHRSERSWMIRPSFLQRDCAHQL